MDFEKIKTVAIANSLHKDWKKSRLQPNKTYRPKWEQIKDKAFIEYLSKQTLLPKNIRALGIYTENEIYEIDIANSTFKQLSPEWQKEFIEVAAIVENKTNIKMEEVLALLHRHQWTDYLSKNIAKEVKEILLELVVIENHINIELKALGLNNNETPGKNPTFKQLSPQLQNEFLKVGKLLGKIPSENPSKIEVAKVMRQILKQHPWFYFIDKTTLNALKVLSALGRIEYEIGLDFPENIR